jgi:outer membrane receptor for ferrienterochelin and colicins
MRFYATLWFLICSMSLVAQSTTVSGKILSEGTPVAFASVLIESPEFRKGASTNEQGEFEIKAVPFGEYTLKVSSVGYKALSQPLTVNESASRLNPIELTQDRLNLDQVVVSATRNELDRKEAPVVVSVIQPELFSATQSFSVSEVLNYQPGLRVETNCQNCGFTQVRINGLEGSYSQILINSRPIFSALNSVYGLEQIPVNIIDRVEVVRSGGSALFGSNAIAGTINIITKDPIENSWQVGSNFSLIDGSTPDNNITFNGSIVNDEGSQGLTFYGMRRNRDSFDANDDGFTELTALENTTFGAKAFMKPGEHNKISLDFSAINEYRRGGDRLNLAPHFTDITEELNHNTLITGITFDQFTSDYLNKFSVYLSAQNTNRDSYYGGLGGGRTAQDSALAMNAYGNTEDLALVSGLQYTRYINGHTLTLGTEYQLSSVEDRVPGYNRIVDQEVNNLGFYGQFEWKPTRKFTALIGARLDNSRVNGTYDIGNIIRKADYNETVLSPRLTVLYDLSKNLQFRGGYARGFRAPQAFNEDLHISSVGGEPLFVILSDDLSKELSDAYTASLNYSREIGNMQMDVLVEGFYTDLQNPFAIVSTGATLPNGSILEEVRNGEGAYVSGANFELGIAPSKFLIFQFGGTAQVARYKEDQVLFEPETDNEDASIISTDRFIRTPNFYGYLNLYWNVVEPLNIDITGTYTGSMLVPRVIDESGLIELNQSQDFYDVNAKLSYSFKPRKHFSVELTGGVQNIFNSFQSDLDTGPTRDSDYVYGPARPRTFFIGLKIGDFH